MCVCVCVCMCVCMCVCVCVCVCIVCMLCVMCVYTQLVHVCNVVSNTGGGQPHLLDMDVEDEGTIWFLDLDLFIRRHVPLQTIMRNTAQENLHTHVCMQIVQYQV